MAVKEACMGMPIVKGQYQTADNPIFEVFYIFEREAKGQPPGACSRHALDGVPEGNAKLEKATAAEVRMFLSFPLLHARLSENTHPLRSAGPP